MKINSKLRRGLLIGGSTIFAFLVILMILPFAFKGKISTVAKDKINGMMNAKVDYTDVNISFIRNFPSISVKLEDFKIVGVDSFSTDTLVQAKNINLVLNLSSLFSDKGYEVSKMEFNDPKVFAHVLKSGKANWDVMKEDSTKEQTPDTAKMSFNLKLKDFSITNADITYWDEEGNMKAVIKGLNHHTAGDLTADSSLLETKTSLKTLDFWMDGVKYISQATAEFNADINANLNKMIFTFSKNESTFNAIVFSLNGWFQMLDDGYDMDLKLNTEKVDFKSILSLVPAMYAESFDGMKAGGKVSMSGFMKGKMVGETYPAFNFNMKAENGWFQYPSLPQKVDQINVAIEVSNPGKTLDETVVDISKFALVMAGNPFSAQLHLATPMSDPDMILKAVGKIDLSKVKDIYPLEAGTELNGIFDMNMNFAGKMSYYEKNQYDKFTFGGQMTISNMVAKMAALPQPVSISTAKMVFNNRYVDLSTLQLKIGKNDLTASGKLENFVAYALHDKVLKGNLDLKSNYMNASDFMTPDDKTTQADTSKLAVVIVPKNIDFNMTADFKQLLYDKMTFTNAKGVLTVLNGDVKFQNMGLQAFGGSMLVNGLYSTNDPKKPAVNFEMNITDVFFAEMFKQVDMIKKLAPIFEKATGKFSMKMGFNSLLKQDMMPDLVSMLGNGSFSTKSVGLANVPAIAALANSLKRSDLNPMAVKDLAMMFEIKDGKVYTKPFDVKVSDVKMNLGGATGLDQSIAYVGKVQLPDKLNLGKFSTVSFKVGGTFAKPKVELDLKNTVTDMVKDATAKLKAEATQKVDDAKQKALEEARKQKEAAIKAAQAQADKLVAEAQQAGEKLVAEAQKQGDALVAKANNPISKKLAQVASQKLVDEARKKSADLTAKAQTEGQKLVQKANDQVKL